MKYKIPFFVGTRRLNFYRSQTIATQSLVGLALCPPQLYYCLLQGPFWSDSLPPGAQKELMTDDRDRPMK